MGASERGNSEPPKADTIRFDNGFSGRISTSDKHDRTKVYNQLSEPVQKAQKQTSAQQVEPDWSGLRPDRTAGFGVIDLDGSEIRETRTDGILF